MLSYRGTVGDLAIQKVMNAIFNKFDPPPTIGKIIFSQPSNPSFTLIIDINPTVLVQEERITVGQFKPIKTVPSLIPLLKPGIEEQEGIIKGLSPIIMRMVSGKRQQLTLTFITYVTVKGGEMTPKGIKVKISGMRLNDLACELRWGWMKLIIVLRSRVLKKRTIKHLLLQYLEDFTWEQYSDVIFFSEKSVFEGVKPTPTPSPHPPRGRRRGVTGPPGKYKEPEDGYEFEKI